MRCFGTIYAGCGAVSNREKSKGGYTTVLRLEGLSSLRSQAILTFALRGFVALDNFQSCQASGA